LHWAVDGGVEMIKPALLPHYKTYELRKAVTKANVMLKKLKHVDNPAKLDYERDREIAKAELKRRNEL
jgi:hypothetical protein